MGELVPPHPPHRLSCWTNAQQLRSKRCGKQRPGSPIADNNFTKFIISFFERKNLDRSSRLELNYRKSYSTIRLCQNRNIQRLRVSMKQFINIEISFEVYQRIEAERKSFSDSRDNALRRLLGMEENGSSPKSDEIKSASERGIDLGFGVYLPHGTEMRMRYKGEYHYGIVQDSAIYVDDTAYFSASDSAKAIAKYNVNGWYKWEVKLPGSESWVLLDSIRKRR